MIRILVLLLCASCVQAQTAAPVVRRTPIDAPRPQTFTLRAIAPDNQTKLVMLRWAKRLTDKIEDRLGTRAIVPRSSVWIIVREDAGEPDAACWQSVAFGEIQQKVGIRHIERVERDVADAALCRAVLMNWVSAKGSAQQSDTRLSLWVEHTVPERVPDWLCRALARSLHPALRATDSSGVMEAFKKGKLFTLEAFLEKVSTDQRDSLEEARLLEAMGTELMEWLISFETPGPRFDDLIARLASGSGLTLQWIENAVPESGGDRDIQSHWEEWIRGYENRILIPGGTRAVDMERLGELTRIDEKSDMRMEDGRAPGAFRDLSKLEKNTKLDAFVVSRTHELRVLALGRSPAFAEVIELYCEYLGALRQGADVKEPLELLSQAEKKHASLRRDMK